MPLDADEEEEQLQRWKRMLAQGDMSSDDDDDDGHAIPHSFLKKPTEHLAPPPLASARGGIGSASSSGGNKVGFSLPTTTAAAPAAPSATAAAMGGEFRWDGLGQAKVLQDQNTALLNKLQNAENENNKLREILSTTSGPAEQKDAKILELARKNRALSLALEKEKAKTQKLEKDATTFEKQVSTLNKKMEKMSSLPPQRGGGGVGGGAAGDEKDDETPKLQNLSDKLKDTQNKISEQRLTIDTLKAEIQKYQRILQKEIGEDAPLDKILEEGGGGGWRGRAQRIALLKAQNRDLRNELKHAVESAEKGIFARGGGGGGVGLSTPGAGGGGGGGADDALFDATRARIEKLQQDRKGQADSLASELAAAKEEIIALKRQRDAVQARMKILEGDTKSLREKIQIVLEKTENDNKLIDALQQELEDKKDMLLRGREKERERDREREERDRKAAALANNNGPTTFEDLMEDWKRQRIQISRQEKIIISLQNDIKTKDEREKQKDREREERDDAVENARLLFVKKKLEVVEGELQRANETIDELRGRNDNLQAQYDALSHSLRLQTQKTAELERKLDKNPVKRPTPPDKVQALIDQLNATSAELDALHNASRTAITEKQKENDKLRETMVRQREAFEEAIAFANRQLEQMNRRM